ncbi:MAG: hypothetical protein AAGJ08_18405 [Cyanobacteria bacterium P01_H01_bin.35]
MASDLNDVIINHRDLEKLTGIIYRNYTNDKWGFVTGAFVMDSYSVSKEIIRPSLIRSAKAKENLYQAKCKKIQLRYGIIFLSTVVFVPLFIILLVSHLSEGGH